jgi:hypothetical protein
MFPCLLATYGHVPVHYRSANTDYWMTLLWIMPGYFAAAHLLPISFTLILASRQIRWARYYLIYICITSISRAIAADAEQLMIEGFVRAHGMTF